MKIKAVILGLIAPLLLTPVTLAQSMPDWVNMPWGQGKEAVLSEVNITNSDYADSNSMQILFGKIKFVNTDYHAKFLFSDKKLISVFISNAGIDQASVKKDFESLQSALEEELGMSNLVDYSDGIISMAWIEDGFSYTLAYDPFQNTFFLSINP